MKVTIILGRLEIQEMVRTHVGSAMLPYGHEVESIELRAYSDTCEIEITPAKSIPGPVVGDEE